MADGLRERSNLDSGKKNAPAETAKIKRLRCQKARKTAFRLKAGTTKGTVKIERGCFYRCAGCPVVIPRATWRISRLNHTDVFGLQTFGAAANAEFDFLIFFQ